MSITKAPVTSRDNSRAREKQPPRKAIDGTTIAEIARLCARLLTEAEACRQIGINPASWRNWKSRNRNSEKFAALLEAFRANRIDDLISKIERSADGIGMKQPDWRAAAFLLSVTDKRFNPNTPAPEPPRDFSVRVQIGLQAGLAMYQELADKNAKPAQAIALPAEPKQLTDAGHE